ncbi:MAG: transcriptional regulator, partial [Clostridia bacterium]|nr:transcriptional regulator [Clostridia bacterium]
MNALSLIQKNYSSMSPVEKRIADCILADPEAAINATVVYISAKAEVSEGSVMNFASMLGFKGFSQMKINLAQNLSTYSVR